MLLRNYGTYINGPVALRQFAADGRAELWNSATGANSYMSFGTNGTARMFINLNGTVGINTSDSTVAQFVVQTDASSRSYNSVFRMFDGATFKTDCVVGWNVGGQYTHFGNYQNYPLAFRTDDTNRIYITAGTGPTGGYVGIGTDTPKERLEVNGNIKLTTISTGKNGVYGQVGDSDFWFVGGGATASNAGYLDIATGDDSGTEPIYISQYGPGDPLTGTLVRRGTLLDASGNTTFPGTVTAVGFYNTSDIRLKNVVDKEYNVSDIEAISYTWKDETKGSKIQIGYSAQEVQKYIPDSVSEDENGLLSINYIQVLIAKIAELEKRIKQLEK
jgi:hypothetical protein